MSARVQSHSRGKLRFEHGRHEYLPPYDCNRSGGKLDQPREPYVDIHKQGKHCRLLTTFATSSSTTRSVTWKSESDGSLSHQDKKHDRFSVRLSQSSLHYETPHGRGSLSLAAMDT